MYNKPMVSVVQEDEAQRLSRGSSAQIHLAREVIGLRTALREQKEDTLRDQDALEKELWQISDNHDIHVREGDRLKEKVAALERKLSQLLEQRLMLTRVMVSAGKELSFSDDRVVYPDIEVT